MSVKQDVIDLLAAAKDELLRVEGLAVSERNRVLDGLAHALSAATTMVVDEPASKPVDEVEKPAPVAEAAPKAPVVEAPAERADDDHAAGEAVESSGQDD